MNAPANKIDWSRYQGSTSTYDPFVSAAAQPDPLQGVSFADYGKTIMAGGADLVSSVGWLLQRTGFDDIGSTIQTLGNDAVDFWNDSLSDSAKSEISKQIIRKDPYSGEYEWGDPSFHTVGLMGAQSLLGTAAGMGAGAGLTKTLQVFANPFGRKALTTTLETGAGRLGLQGKNLTGQMQNLAKVNPARLTTQELAAAKKLKLVDTVLGATGFGAGEGLIGGMSAGASVQEQIMSLPHEKLYENERYRQVYDSADGMPELERHAYAAETVAAEAGTLAGWQAGLTTSLLGAPMGAYFGRILGGAKLSSTLPRGIATGATGEAAQEFAQSGFEQYISNLARQPFEPSIDDFEGVLNAAVGGALAGGLLGGGFGVAGVGAAKQELAQERVVEDRENLEKIGGDLTGAAERAARAGASRKEIFKKVQEAISGKVDPLQAIDDIKELEKDARRKTIPEGEEVPAVLKPRDPPDEPPGGTGAVMPHVKIKTDEEKEKARQLNAKIAEEQKRETTVRPKKAALEVRSPEQIEAATKRIAESPVGAKQTSFAGQDPIETQFKLVELSELMASHDLEGNVNTQYPQVLQPRDRSRAASREWLADKAQHLRPELITQGVSFAEGTPVISPEGIVESGNGRKLIMDAVYAGKAQSAAAYRDYLKEHAAEFGLAPEQLKGMKNPILVRERLTPMDEPGLIRMTQQANTTETAALSPVEQANVDAGNFTDNDLALFSPDESGNVLAASNDTFVKSFIGRMTAAERGKVLTESGKPTKQLADRIQAAIFAKAYDDDRMLALMAEDSDPDVKNIVSALTRAAPAFARARATGDLGNLNIVDPLLDAVELLRAARRSGVAMQEHLAQMGLFGQTAPLTASLATFLDTNIRAPKRIGEALGQMGAFIEKEMDSKKNASLFGQERDVGLAEIVAAADAYMTKEYGAGAGIDLESTAAPEQPAPAPTSRRLNPEPTGQSPALKAGVASQKFAEGETPLTQTGRKTSPFPRVDTTTNQRATNTLKRVDKWLMENALAEAESRGDNFNAPQFRANIDRPSQSDKDSAEQYLFGESQPEVIRPLLKPLVGKAPAVETNKATDKGIERQRKDPRIKKYIQQKRPLWREREAMVDYRTASMMAVNKAQKDGADQDVIDFLKGEYDYALEALEHMKPTTDWRKTLSKKPEVKAVPPATIKAFDEVMRAHELLGKAWQREQKGPMAKNEAKELELLPGLIKKIEALTPEQLAGLNLHVIESIRDPDRGWGIPQELVRPLGLISGPEPRDAQVGQEIEVWEHSEAQRYMVHERGVDSLLVESLPNTPSFSFRRLWTEPQGSGEPNPRRGQYNEANLADTLEEARARFDEEAGEDEADAAEELAPEQAVWDGLMERYGMDFADQDQLRKDINSSPWVKTSGKENFTTFTSSLEAVVAAFADGMAAEQRIIGTDDRAYFHNRGYVHASKGDHDAPDYKSRTDMFPAPQQKVFAAKQVTEVISLEAAKARLEEWKAEARRIGQEEDHSNEVIISLFDHSGAWSQPWAEAGYDVRRFDIKDGDDLLAFFPTADIMDIHQSGKRVVGVLSACPCTSFAASGARWWDSQHDAPNEEMVENKFGAWASKYFDTPLEYSQTLVEATKVVIEFTDPRFYALENPRGRIARMTGLPDPTLTFDPSNYGDPYTKETKLWGEFNPNLPQANVEPTQGSLMHQLRGDTAEGKAARSLTPEGFSYAFFMGQRSSQTVEQTDEADQQALFSRTAPGQGDMFLNHPETIPEQRQAAPEAGRKPVDTLTAEEIEIELVALEGVRIRVAQQAAENRVSPLFATSESRYQYGTEANDLRVRDLMRQAEQGVRRELNVERRIPEQEGLQLGASRPNQNEYEELLAMLRKAGVAVDRDMSLPQLRHLKAQHDRGSITDVGEKIGGARKDDAPTPRRGQSKGDGKPAWLKKYHIMEEVKSASRGGITAYKPVSILEMARGDAPGMLQEAGKGLGTWAIYAERGSWPKKMKGGFATPAEAEESIPLIHLLTNHSISKSAETGRFYIYRRVAARKTVPIREGFETREEALTYMAENVMDIINWKAPTPERPHLENLQRFGPDRRQGNITPEKFLEEFGFRGAEFGNWLPQDERQEVLNRAYDSMMDLANILQVPPRSLSLNGELAIGFGSRGQGLGKAKAHYESGRVVINLTRIKGAGSLAHEWLHAFDHYLARQSGKTDTPAGRTKSKGRIKEDTFVSHGFSYNAKTREEVKAAFNNVMQKITRRSKEFDRNLDALEKIEGRAHDTLGRELTDVLIGLSRDLDPKYYKRKNKAAPVKDQTELAKLTKQILDGKPGDETYIQGKGWLGRNSFDAFEKISVIYKAARGRTGFAEHDILTRALQTYRNWERAKEQVTAAKLQNTETRTVSTDYYSEAKKLDRGRASNYYSTPHELAARAFESWIYDNFMAADRRNDYLVHSVTNDLYMAGVNPYPEGVERSDIGIAFRELFDTIQASAPDESNNVALFSRAQSGKPISSVTLTETVMIEETGEVAEIEHQADKLLRQVDQRISNAEKIRECLRS